MKVFLIVLLCVIAFLALLFCLIGWFAVDFAINKKSKLFMDNISLIPKMEKTFANPGTYPDVEKKYDDYPLDERVKLMRGEMDLDDDHKEYWIKSFDGLDMRCYLYEANEPTDKWIILVHGYGNSAAMMVRMFDAQMMRDKGYNILLPDLRAHGSSGGKYVSMGFYDRMTVKGWINWIVEKNPNARIALMGVSMGAATVMLTSGESDLPDNVKCTVEDCGFTNAYVQFEDVIKNAGVPAKPIIDIMAFFAKLRTGYSFKKDASPIDAVKRTKLPMLFLHGEKDDFVPTWMVQPLYDACPTEKDILIIPDAIHARSNKYHPEIYWPKVWSFIEKYV